MELSTMIESQPDRLLSGFASRRSQLGDLGYLKRNPNDPSDANFIGLKARIRWIAVLMFAAILSISSAARAQEQSLVVGFNVGRTLSVGENHIYTITLQDGTAVIGGADQHDIDLVIDIFGPDGKLIRTVDSPNGTEGPEPIDVTAFKAGTYKLAIRANDASAKPGKYVMKISRVLSVEENGKRMAEK